MTASDQRPECLAPFGALKLGAGTTVFQNGLECENFYFLLRGTVRVDLINSDGKSVLLYRIEPNETCILTTSCLLADEVYCAEAITETEVEVIAVPRAEFLKLLDRSADFRALVFHSFSSRLSTMMGKIDEVSFASIDQRLARRLLELGGDGAVIDVTHEQLAKDLGSAREVISRKLLDWEKQKIINRGRGSVQVTAVDAINRLANLGD